MNTKFLVYDTGTIKLYYQCITLTNFWSCDNSISIFIIFLFAVSDIKIIFILADIDIMNILPDINDSVNVR